MNVSRLGPGKTYEKILTAKPALVLHGAEVGRYRIEGHHAMFQEH
jgi:hypothetical protein